MKQEPVEAYELAVKSAKKIHEHHVVDKKYALTCTGIVGAYARRAKRERQPLSHSNHSLMGRKAHHTQVLFHEREPQRGSSGFLEG